MTTASSGVGAARIASSFASTRWSAAAVDSGPARGAFARRFFRSRGDSGLGGAGFSGDSGGSGGATRSSGAPRRRRRSNAAHKSDAAAIAAKM